MKAEDSFIRSDDGCEISFYKWLPAGRDAPKACVQIAHGLAEHARRYGDFASFLALAGYAVYASDHRGHGKTGGKSGELGYFADENGWDKVVGDMLFLTREIKSAYPDQPFFLFGHSMGSFLSRDYIANFAGETDGVILSGTGGDPGIQGALAIMIVKIECAIKGRKAKSSLMNGLIFGAYNKAFKPARTDFDWLSRDRAEVDRYIADPDCGFVSSAGLYLDLLSGVRKIHSRSNFGAVPKDLPIYIFSGERDPVGNNSKGVTRVYNSYKKAGLSDVSLKLYKDGRHEMLHEVNKEEVFQDVLNWLEAHLGRK